MFGGERAQKSPKRAHFMDAESIRKLYNHICGDIDEFYH